MRLFDDSSSAGWIVVVGWETFQHYRDRTPIWIKTYLDLLERDEYLDLPPATRGLLHDLWLLTARRSGVVSANTLRLSRVLGCQVRRSQLEALADAGFIAFSASKPVPKPEQNRSRSGPRARVEAETEKRERPRDVDLGTNGARGTGQDLPVDLELGRARLVQVAPKVNLRMMEDFALPPAAWFAAAEEIDEQHPSEPERYAFRLFQTWAQEKRYAADAPFVGPEPS